MTGRQARVWILCALWFSSCTKSDVPGPTPFNGNAYSQQQVGASAKDLLKAAPFKSLHISVEYMNGYAPDQQALSQLQQFLATYLSKPGGIQVSSTAIPDQSLGTYTDSDIRQLEHQYRQSYSNDSVLNVYVIYVDGSYSDNAVLGLAYQNTSICMMGQTIHAHSGGINQVSRSVLEGTVLDHEFGHLLGLVNLGAPMQVAHEDASHPHHCSNQQCLMYYAVETTSLGGILGTGSIPGLDADCQNDLKALASQ